MLCYLLILLVLLERITPTQHIVNVLLELTLLLLLLQVEVLELIHHLTVINYIKVLFLYYIIRLLLELGSYSYLLTPSIAEQIRISLLINSSQSKQSNRYKKKKR